MSCANRFAVLCDMEEEAVGTNPSQQRGIAPFKPDIPGKIKKIKSCLRKTVAGKGGHKKTVHFEKWTKKGDDTPYHKIFRKKEMTLDEWNALQKQRRLEASFNIRKAGEGVDSAQWKKGVAYKKITAEEEDSEEEEEKEDEDRHVHRKQLVTDIRIIFADTPRRGGRGRGRGGPRGGDGGRGGGFGGAERGERPSRGGPHEAAPRMDDETNFPRLVKSEA